MKGRPPTTMVHIGAALHSALRAEPPQWVSPSTLDLARDLLDALRTDAARAVLGSSDVARDGAERVGVATATMQRWMRGGWLADLRRRMAAIRRQIKAGDTR